MSASPRLTDPPPIPASTAQNSWLTRFPLTHRLVHWTNACAFLALAASGFGLHVGALRRPLDAALAHLPNVGGQPISMVGLHLLIAIFYVCGPLLWIILGDRRAMASDAAQLVHFDADDRAWLAMGGGLLGPSTDHAALPRQGRFNAGQKLNALASILAFGGFIVTGVILTIWPSSASEGHRPFIIAQALHLHALLALASVALVAGHIYLAALNPATRHSLQGMLHGRVRRSWAGQHHPKWVSELEAREDGRG